jgi:hypothetical protein
MNPIMISQTREEIELAFQVHSHAAICGVRLAHSRMHSPPPDQLPKGPLFVRFTMRSRMVEAPKGRLRIEVDFHMAGQAEPQEAKERAARKETVLKVACTYAVDYELVEGFEPSQKQIKAFKDGNVIYHCWPYFREYLQDCIQRMGFPPLTAPFLRVLPRPPKGTKAGPRKAED